MFNVQEDELKEADFDPRFGFTIKNLLVKDSNWYKCSIEKDGEEHAVNYVLSVHRKCGFSLRLIQSHMYTHIYSKAQYCDRVRIL